MTVLHASQAGSLAGLWSGRGMHILLVFAAAVVGVFVPAFLLADRWPRRGVIVALGGLALACALAALGWIVWLIASGEWQRGTVVGALGVVPALFGAAAALWRASRHGAEMATLRPAGDPIAHWSSVLVEHGRWWIRSRAARELGALAAAEARAREALETARRHESNRRVRAAIARSLQALPASTGS